MLAFFEAFVELAYGPFKNTMSNPDGLRLMTQDAVVEEEMNEFEEQSPRSKELEVELSHTHRSTVQQKQVETSSNIARQV